MTDDLEIPDFLRRKPRAAKGDLGKAPSEKEPPNSAHCFEPNEAGAISDCQLEPVPGVSHPPVLPSNDEEQTNVLGKRDMDNPAHSMDDLGVAGLGVLQTRVQQTQSEGTPLQDTVASAGAK